MEHKGMNDYTKEQIWEMLHEAFDYMNKRQANIFALEDKLEELGHDKFFYLSPEDRKKREDAIAWVKSLELFKKRGKRIDREQVMARVKKVWDENPDLRFLQLIGNVYDGFKSESYKYYLWDEVFIEELEGTYNRLNKEDNGTN